MTEFIRVRWNDSGTEQSIPKPSAVDAEAYEVLDEDATDQNLRVLPPVLAEAKEPTKAELLDEIARRNQGRDESDQIPTQGNKPDLIKAIEADDNKGSDL